MIDVTNPANSEVIVWLKAHGNPNPPPGPAWSIVDGYELHSHPELVEKMDSLISPNHNVSKAFSYGCRVHSTNGIIFALAAGMLNVALRYPDAKLRAGKTLFTELGPDWILVEAFRNEVYLKAFYHVAYRYASGDVSA